MSHPEDLTIALPSALLSPMMLAKLMSGVTAGSS
jgi:hypothetical protein